MPNRAMSKRDIALAIISKAQQASPNESGHTADLRPQLMSASTEVTARLRRRSSGTSMSGSAIGSVLFALEPVDIGSLLDVEGDRRGMERYASPHRDRSSRPPDLCSWEHTSAARSHSKSPLRNA